MSSVGILNSNSDLSNKDFYYDVEFYRTESYDLLNSDYANIDTLVVVADSISMTNSLPAPSTVSTAVQVLLLRFFGDRVLGQKTSELFNSIRMVG
jgi:hypothetical protein